jgi:hypothetical protein
VVEEPEIMTVRSVLAPRVCVVTPPLTSHKTMIDLYKSGATTEQVAQAYGFSKRSIKRLLQQHGVRRERRTNT